MSTKNNNHGPMTLIKINLIILCIFAVFYGFLQLSDYLVSILVLLGASFILTYLLLGPVDLIDRWIGQLVGLRQMKRLRIVSVLIVYLAFVLIILLVVLGALPSLISQTKGFAGELPSYLETVEKRVEAFAEQNSGGIGDDVVRSWIRAVINDDEKETKTIKIEGESDTRVIITRSDKLPESLSGAEIDQSAIGQATLIAQRYASKTMASLLDFGKNTLTTAIYTLTAFVMVFYFLLDGRSLKKGFVNFLPTHMRSTASDYLNQIHLILYKYIQGQVLLSFLAGVAMYYVCLFAGLKFAGLLGAVFGVVSIIPVLGPSFGIIPVVLVAIFSGGAYAWVAVVAFAGVYYLLKVYLLLPKLFPERLEIHPVVIILSFLASIKTAHLLGILMAYPAACLISGTYHYLRGKKLVTAEG